MTKLAGDHVQILVGGYELTSDSNRIELGDSRHLFDVTAFGDEVHQFLPGQRMITVQHAGFMNSDSARSHPVLNGADVDGLFSVYVGQNAVPNAGDPVFSLLTRQARYGSQPQFDQLIPFYAAFTNRGEFGGWGIALTPPTSFSSSSSGNALDSGTASSQGGLACLHVLTATDTDSYRIRIEGSTRGAFDGEESTLATFDLDGSAIGSEQTKINGTIPRYTRWKATRRGSAGDTVKIAVSLIRS